MKIELDGQGQEIQKEFNAQFDGIERMLSEIAQGHSVSECRKFLKELRGWTSMAVAQDKIKRDREKKS